MLDPVLPGDSKGESLAEGSCSASPLSLPVTASEVARIPWPRPFLKKPKFCDGDLWVTGDVSLEGPMLGEVAMVSLIGESFHSSLVTVGEGAALDS